MKDFCTITSIFGLGGFGLAESRMYLQKSKH
jgi:hypothetical protein